MVVPPTRSFHINPLTHPNSPGDQDVDTSSKETKKENHALSSPSENTTASTNMYDMKVPAVVEIEKLES